MSDAFQVTAPGKNGQTLPIAGDDPFLSFIERAMRDPQFDVNKLSALLEERSKIIKENQRRAYHSALSLVQAELNQVGRDKPNDAFHSRYATLEALDAEAKPLYTKYGFALSFNSAPPATAGHVRLVCTISHRDGHIETAELSGPIAMTGPRGNRIGMNEMQAVGSSIAYLRRYLLMLIFNLVQANDPDDNDGNATGPARSGPTYEENKRKWLDALQGRMDAADTQDEAQAILDEKEVKDYERIFAKDPDAKAKIKELRETMIKRIWQGAKP